MTKRMTKRTTKKTVTKTLMWKWAMKSKPSLKTLTGTHSTTSIGTTTTAMRRRGGPRPPASVPIVNLPAAQREAVPGGVVREEAARDAATDQRASPLGTNNDPSDLGKTNRRHRATAAVVNDPISRVTIARRLRHRERSRRKFRQSPSLRHRLRELLPKRQRELKRATTLAVDWTTSAKCRRRSPHQLRVRQLPSKHRLPKWSLRRTTRSTI